MGLRNDFFGFVGLLGSDERDRIACFCVILLWCCFWIEK